VSGTEHPIPVAGVVILMMRSVTLDTVKNRMIVSMKIKVGKAKF
jgi:hypothetical protein